MIIGIVAPAGAEKCEILERVARFSESRFGPDVQLRIHPQCFLHAGHFAGPDDARRDAFVEYANDPGIDAIWFARGGYGSNRIAADAIPRLNGAARNKLYLGYSDMGFMLAGLYRNGFTVAHGPMPADIARENGEEAVLRALNYLTRRDPATLEPHVQPGRKVAAFNMTILSALLDTDLMPDLSGHVLMLEDVAEYMYATDRRLFHITANPMIRKVAGIRLGRVSAVPENDPDFGQSAEEIVAYWCEKSGIPYLGQADIGHDSANKIVPFTIR